MLDTSPSVSFVNSPQGSYKKKLIEVALPLQAINAACAREKSIRHGHPSTLHLWWARRPLAACRAVLFASLVDDPSSRPDEFPTVEAQEKERARLFTLIEQLVQWENSLNENVLAQARAEIRKSVGDDLPAIYDPFSGGGAIPIEAQRLGLPSFGSDLNPVAVLISKAMTEIPWRFKGRRPVHPSLQGPLSQRTWERATGLAADVEAYGQAVLEDARKRLMTHYPSVRLEGGRDASVIAWIWARTVKCNNPVCGAAMPLVRSFTLSDRSGKGWSIEPIVDRKAKTVRFETRAGKPSRGGTVNRRGAECIVCGEPVTLSYIREEGKAKRLGAQLMAIVAEGERGRVYVAPTETQAFTAMHAQPSWTPDTDLPEQALGFRVQGYGMTKHRDLFTSRQLLTLTTFSDLVREAHAKIYADAKEAGLADDDGIEQGGHGARAYADAVVTYLAFSLDKVADYCSTLCIWNILREQIAHVFGRQTLSMTWDYAEANPIGDSSGSFMGAVQWSKKAIESASCASEASVFQQDASYANFSGRAVSTDPPYYDNVPYADLSDYFYVWLRRTALDSYPNLFSTILVPKTQELIAEPSRFGGSREKASAFFEAGLADVFAKIDEGARRDVPITVFYAFKQTERNEDATDAASESSVGWETMLSGLISAGIQIVGTWPISSERATRMRGQNSNALGSSIVLVCRPRAGSVTCSRAEFVRALRSELPTAVARLREASLAPTDLQQAALGPGMAIFSRFSRVLEPDDTSMTVRSALFLINEALGQTLLGEISGVDAETHFALAWFDENGYSVGQYTKADVTLRAKNASIDPLVRSGVALSESGRVQLLAPHEIEVETAAELRTFPAWAQTMHVVAGLVGEDGSDERAATVLREIGSGSVEHIKDIAYHCYLICDRAKRSAEARDFNALVQAWPDLLRLASERGGDTLL
ncbi:MAG: DUF1156 domain-containing protein [bacterium]|nr:DUF1156 domain-containing protein [bacterium]